MRTLAQQLGLGSPRILGSPSILGDPTQEIAAVTEADKITKYVKEGYVASDRIDVALGPLTTIPAGATAQFTGQVVDPFKPEKLFVPSTLAPGLFITAASIGSTQLVDGNAVGTAAEKFSEVSLHADVSWPTVPTAVAIVVSVTNRSALPIAGVSMSANGIRLRRGG